MIRKEFRLKLSWELIEEGLDKNNERETRGHTIIESSSSSSRASYTKQRSELFTERLVIENNHLPEYRENRIACEWCKFATQRNEGKSNKSQNRSYIYCTACNVALCCSRARNCYIDYHTETDIIV